MRIYQVHVCTFIPHMKFLCSNLQLGALCTDNDNANTNDEDTGIQRTKHEHDGIDSFGKPK